MDNLEINDLHVVPCVNSRFIQPSRVVFKQNGGQRTWDYLIVQNSVSCLVFNTTRQAFILVKQFRPAVYMHVNRKLHNKNSGANPVSVKADDSSMKALADASAGITYELCAGIVDQNISLKSLMKQELLEECGYNVPEENIHKITSCRAGVGSTGSVQTSFYAEVTDDMIIDGAGGGNLNEGERIEVFYLPLEKSREFVFDETKEKPLGLMFAFMWYFDKFKV
ncbi:uridine diphosphate glucose pyrophosphatase NUDT14-like isoform X1 [Actinia tenebrosa]|uniref:Uridine diphosphate glucose pyrophosphatase NUDT14 n=1 Tax=Actinia tenebrosa TaxID=6105 RepID=A0A6P8HEH8_ACTTE|nr:uridine diphosphate glucose pyrophosphatase NUDT14-like isoform X1 [Actinia tenebrosa]